MATERDVRLMLIFDPNSKDSLEMLNTLNPEGDIEQIEVQKCRKFLPGIRDTPAVGVLLWASDLQGIMSDVESFANYLKGESEIKAASAVAQRYVPDDVALTQPHVWYDIWSSNSVEYVVGDIRLYGNELYRCLTAHTSQTDWTPDAAPSLWVKIADPSIEYPDWVQPTGSTDAYASGAKVTHNNKKWTSDVDANVWEPGVYGWTEVTK